MSQQIQATKQHLFSTCFNRYKLLDTPQLYVLIMSTVSMYRKGVAMPRWDWLPNIPVGTTRQWDGLPLRLFDCQGKAWAWIELLPFQSEEQRMKHPLPNMLSQHDLHVNGIHVAPPRTTSLLSLHISLDRSITGQFIFVDRFTIKTACVPLALLGLRASRELVWRAS